MKEIGRFVHWCNVVKIQATPPLSIALATAYLSHIYNESKSYSTLVLVQAALKWYHSFLPSNQVNPFNSSICHNLLEAAKREKPSTKRKLPASTEMIKRIVDKYGKNMANLKELRIACICSLGFAGFLRYDELSNIAAADLEISASHLRIFIPRAKNDSYREGNYVYISRLNNKYCPVNMLERYIAAGEIDVNSRYPCLDM